MKVELIKPNKIKMNFEDSDKFTCEFPVAIDDVFINKDNPHFTRLIVCLKNGEIEKYDIRLMRYE